VNDLVCASGVDYLMEYLEGELDPDLRAAIEAHVAGCPRCVAFLESYHATPAILRRATAAALPAELGESLLAAIRARI
jgi:anti-sigma factor (TIGR02949 family)